MSPPTNDAITVQVFYGEQSISTNLSLPLSTPMDRLRVEVLKSLRDHLKETWSEVSHQGLVERDAKKIVVLNENGCSVDASKSASLSELGFNHNSVIRAIVAAPPSSSRPLREGMNNYLVQKELENVDLRQEALATQEKELKKIRQNFSKAADENQALKAQIQQLRNRPEEVTVMQNPNESTMQDTSEKIPEWAINMQKNYEKMNGGLEANIADLNRKDAARRKENKELKGEIHAVRKEINILEKKNAVLEKENDLLKTEIVGLKRTHKDEMDEILSKVSENSQWIEINATKDVKEKLAFRKVLDKAQAYLAQESGLAESTSVGWRRALSTEATDSESRLQYARKLLQKSKDPKVLNILNTPEALALVVDKCPKARSDGNQAAHKLPTKILMEDYLKKKDENTKAAYTPLLSFIP